MQWNRSNAIGLALASCTQCGGARHARNPPEVRKGRAIASFGQFLEPVTTVFASMPRTARKPGRFRSSVPKGRSGIVCTSRKREEYMADFSIVTRRVLTESGVQALSIRLLSRGGLAAVQPLPGTGPRQFLPPPLSDRGETRPRYYAEMEPYPLYPLDEYFGGVRAKRIPIYDGSLAQSRAARASACR